MASTFEVERRLANAGYLPQGVDFSPRFTPPADIEGVIRGAATRYGISPDDAVAVARLESGLNPRAQNPRSSAGGLFQFVDSTWNQYGGGNKYDPGRNADAGARYLRDVRDTLAQGLGRVPTVGELYLGHQQGASGALRILQNPDGLARDAVGPDAVVLNGGTVDMTNRDFAARWDRRASRAAGQAPGILDTLGAAARQNIGLVGLLGYGMPLHRGLDDPTFNPITTADQDPALRPYLSEFVDVRNRDEYDRTAERIRRANEDRETLAAAGTFGTIASVAAGILDPINLIPVGGGAWRALKVGRFAEGALTGLLAGGGGAALQELVLQQADPTRTAEESSLNIATGALGGAGLGIGGVIAGESASRLARAGILGAGGATGGAAAGLAEAVYNGQDLGDALATIGTSAVIGGLLGSSVGALARPGRTARDGLHDLARTVDIETDTGNGAIYADVRRQLLAAGRPDVEADAGGRLWQSHVDAMARATGLRQDEVYRSIGLEVRAGDVGLPMDEASRSARAVEQGWSVDTFYHGTKSSFDEFSKAAIGSASDPGWYGKGFYFSKNPEVAAGYASPQGRTEGANILPVRLKMENPLILDHWSGDAERIKTEERLKKIGIEDIGSADPAELTRMAKEAGYDSIIFGNPTDKSTEYVVFEPSQVRSKFAKFDPAEADSTNLLAQSARVVMFPGGRRETGAGLQTGAVLSDPQLFHDALQARLAEVADTLKRMEAERPELGHAAWDVWFARKSAVSNAEFALTSAVLDVRALIRAKKKGKTYRSTPGRIDVRKTIDEVNGRLNRAGLLSLEMNESDRGSRVLFQESRGSVKFGDAVTRIALGARADASTFLHESGHVFLHTLDKLAAQSPELATDMKTVREWLGNDGGAITREQHEQWARGFEAYLREGKAPNSALREVFERFRQWLTTIYRSLADLDVELSDDVREVMDRIIGIDDEPSARPSGPDSLSAASMPQATMEDLRIGRSVEPLARIQSRIPIVGGPDLVLATSPVRSARWAMRKLMRPALATVGDLAGRAEVVTENVESAAGQWHGTEVVAKQRATGAYTEYAKAAAAAGEPVLKRDDVLNAASQAGRRGDSGSKLALPPEAQKAAAAMAKIYREEVFDPLLKQALEHGLLTQRQVDKAAKFADGYVPRVWNTQKIIEKRAQFTNEVVLPQVVNDWEDARAKLTQVRQATRFADEQLRQIESAGIEHGGAEAAAFIAEGPERTPSQIMRENVKALQAALDDASVQWAAGDEARARDLVAIARTPKIARDGMEGIRKGGPALKAEEAQEVQDILLRTRGLRPTDDADIGVRATRAVEAMRERVTVLEDAAKYASEHADATRPNAAISRAAARLKELDAQIGEAERAAGRTSESMRDLGGPGAAKAEVDAWTRYQTLIDERRRVDIRAALLTAADERLRSEAAEAAGDLAAKLKSDAETARAIADQYETALKKSLRERTKAYRVLDAEDNIGRLDEEELPGVASDIVDALIGHTNNRVQYEALKVQARGALKEKTFNVRDERVDGGNGGENWLENDIELLAQRYVRTLAPDIELKRLTGDVNAEPLRQQIIQEYTDRANAMADGRAKTKLDKRQKRDLEAFDGVVARLRGTYGLPTTGAEAWALRAARLAKAYNISRLMGWGWVSQLSDAGRIIFRSGMIRFMGDAVMPMVSNWEAVRMTKRELQLADVATELVRSSMALRGGELFDDYARTSLVEQTAQKIAAGSVRLFGLDHWNQGAKTISGMIAQHTIVDGVRKLASGAEMKPMEIADLSRVGIGAREAEFLLPLIDKFGRDVRGVYIPNSADWDGAGAVDAARLWRGALRQVVDDMVINPGQDRALGMSRPGLSVLTHLETFNLVSTQRTILAGFQRRNAGVMIGSAVMIGLGMLSYWLKAKISEMTFGSTSTWKMPSSPGEWLVQGVNGSGLLGVIGSLDQRLLASTSGALGSEALIGSPTRSRYASADISSLFGPSAGAASVLYTSSQAIGRGDWNWRDTHRARSLLLLQNYFALRGLFDQAEIGINDLLGVRQRPPMRQ